MPHPPEDGAETRLPTEDELLLVDLLYGELEGDERARAEERVEGDEELAGELEAMRSVRSLFRDMPDEDPPQAATAKLLHAAATRGPSKPAAAREDGEDAGVWAWLKRVFAPIALHPGLAAAASLVLVAGIAGTLYLRGEGQVAEPKVSSPAEPARDEAKAEKPDDPAALEEAPAATTVTPDTWESQGGEDSFDEKPATGADRTLDKDLERGPGGASPARKPRPSASRDPAPPPAEESDYPRTRGQVEQTIDVNVPEIPPKQAPRDDADSTAPQAEPEPEEAENEAPADGAEGDDDTTSETRTLHDRAVTFARKGDCAAAAKLGARIRALDSGYYTDVHVRNSDIARCQRSQTDSAATKK